MYYKIKSLNSVFNKNNTKSLDMINKHKNLLVIVNQEIISLNIKYFDHIEAVFFDYNKLILKTNIPELITKFRELEANLITFLKHKNIFKELSIIKVIYANDEINLLKLNKNEPESLAENNNRHSEHIVKAFSDLYKNTSNSEIKSTLKKIIDKHKDD